MMIVFICYGAVDEFLRCPHRVALVHKMERLLRRPDEIHSFASQSIDATAVEYRGSRRHEENTLGVLTNTASLQTSEDDH